MINSLFHPKVAAALEKISKERNFDLFPYKGHICIIKRMMSAESFFGNLNGYVILDEEPENIDDIDCHGGITWSNKAERLFPEFEGKWVIGFDTAHYGDLQPFSIIRDMIIMPTFDNTLILEDENLSYKDFDYVTNECKRIVDQL